MFLRLCKIFMCLSLLVGLTVMAQIEAHDLPHRAVAGDWHHHCCKGIVMAVGVGVEIVINTMTCDVISQGDRL